MLGRILNKGQLIIPKEIRRELEIVPGDLVEIKTARGEITIRPIKKSYTEETRGVVKGKLSLKDLEELYGTR